MRKMLSLIKTGKMYAHSFVPQNPELPFPIVVHDYCSPEKTTQTTKRKREKKTNKKSEETVQYVDIQYDGNIVELIEPSHRRKKKKSREKTEKEEEEKK